jgi:hypothetical protein
MSPSLAIFIAPIFYPPSEQFFEMSEQKKPEAPLHDVHSSDRGFFFKGVLVFCALLGALVFCAIWLVLQMAFRPISHISFPSLLWLIAYAIAVCSFIYTPRNLRYLLKKFLVSFFVTLLVLYGGLHVVYANLNKQGYCISKGRIASDEDKIKIAVERAVDTFPKTIYISPMAEKGFKSYAAKYGITLDDKLFEKSAHYKVLTSYSSTDEFLEKNPDCCRFEERDIIYTYGGHIDYTAEPTFFDWAYARVMDRIWVDYIVDIVGEDGVIHRIVDAERVHINNCSYVWID